MSKAKTDNPEILVFEDAGPRIVTPTDPLVIDYTPATFDNVEVKGGTIYARVDGTTTITKLTITKTS